MRDILFRAKRSDNGEWVEGYYQKRKDAFENDEHLIFRCESCHTWKYVEVDADTLCQYTGLTDKNGNKIWENDVVRKSDINALGYGRVRNCEVSFDKLGCWLLTTKYGDGYWLGSFDAVQLEVIGTIFDNPELLENE